MCELTTEEPTATASDADDERGLSNFPLLQTRAAKALMARSRTVRALLSGSPAFRLLMLGSSISMLGTRISTVAFPMLVLHLNKSPFVTGLVAFAAIMPSMLVYIPAGVLVDRWNPRRVMLASELLRGLAIASVVVALAMYGLHVGIWFLILAMVAEEVLEIFCTLAERRYLSRVVKRDKIVSQQASIEVRTHAVVLAGRPIGPFLFSIEAFLPFLADAASFVASVASLLLVRRIEEPRGVTQRLQREEVIGDIGEGFRWLRRNLRASATVLLMATTSLVAQALILMFLVEAHSKQFSTLAIGVVLAASGGGGAVGSFCSRIVPSTVRSFWLPIQMVAWSVVLAFLALTGGQSAYWSAVAMFILGFTGAIGNVEFGIYIIRTVADNMIAKITSIGQMLAIGGCALGPVLGGYAVQHFGVQGAIWILLVIVMILALASLLISLAAQRVKRVSRAIKKFLTSDGNAAQAKSEAIVNSDPIALRATNGRPPSRIERKAHEHAETWHFDDDVEKPRERLSIGGVRSQLYNARQTSPRCGGRAWWQSSGWPTPTAS